MAKAKGRRPDYDVSVLDATTEKRGRIGGAWINADESISIKLHDFISLDFSHDLKIRLFPCGNGDQEFTDDNEESGNDGF